MPHQTGCHQRCCLGWLWVKDTHKHRQMHTVSRHQPRPMGHVKPNMHVRLLAPTHSAKCSLSNGHPSPGPPPPQGKLPCLAAEPTTPFAPSPVTMTSKYFGFLMSCMAALSMYMWLNSTSGNSSAPSLVTTSFHNWLTCRHRHQQQQQHKQHTQAQSKHIGGHRRGACLCTCQPNEQIRSVHLWLGT